MCSNFKVCRMKTPPKDVHEDTFFHILTEYLPIAVSIFLNFACIIKILGSAYVIYGNVDNSKSEDILCMCPSGVIR